MIRAIQQYFDARISSTLTQNTAATNRVRMATAALLIELAHADFAQDPREIVAAKNAIEQALELSPDDTDALITLATEEAQNMTDYFQFTRLINQQCTLDEKVLVIELMWQVAFADGRIDNYETHFIRRIANLLHVPGPEIVAAKRRALDTT